MKRKFKSLLVVVLVLNFGVVFGISKGKVFKEQYRIGINGDRVTYPGEARFLYSEKTQSFLFCFLREKSDNHVFMSLREYTISSNSQGCITLLENKDIWVWFYEEDEKYIRITNVLFISKNTTNRNFPYKEILFKVEEE